MAKRPPKQAETPQPPTNRAEVPPGPAAIDNAAAAHVDLEQPDPDLRTGDDGARWKGAAALRGLLRPIDELRNDPNNARAHDKRSFDGIRRSLRRFGQLKNVVVDARGVVIAGNGTLEAARREGWSHVVAIDASSLTAEELRAFALADNRTAELSEWNFEALSTELRALPALGIDVTDLGWTPAEIREVGRRAEGVGLIRNEPGFGEPPPGDPVSKVGTVYELGRHKLLVADAVDAAAFLGRGWVAQLITDPPYGVSYKGRVGSIENDDLDDADLADFLRRTLGVAVDALAPGGTVYVCSPPGPLSHTFGGVLKELGVWRQTLVWDKGHFVRGLSDFHYRHETIFYGWKPGAAHRGPPTRTEISVWPIPKPYANDLHPTMKPVELYERAMHCGSMPGDVVADVFAGSGTALIAAENLGRTAMLVEKDPRYADAIRRRWNAYAKAARIAPGSGALE